MRLFDRLVRGTLPLIPKPIVGYFSRRYIAGSEADDAFQVVRRLTGEGSMCTLDILGEFISTPEEASVNLREYQDLVRKVAGDGVTETNISVKLTALGLLLEREQCLDNVRALMGTIVECDNFLRIDMEDSPCTTATLEIYRTVREEFPGRVGVALQSRMRRTMQDLEGLGDGACNFRLCKGIYLEPRDIAYTDPELIRRNFTALLTRMFEAGAYVGIATHDEILVWDALDLIRRFGLTSEQYEFQMLLGVDDELRHILTGAGHRLRVYVPFGRQWYAYSVRRLRENPQIASHALKALFRRS